MIGTTIAGYELQEELGRGAMGSVYLGRKDDERFAVKVIHEQLQASDDLMERFVREAQEVVERRDFAPRPGPGSAPLVAPPPLPHGIVIRLDSISERGAFD